MVVQSIPTPILVPIIKCKGKLKLGPHSVTTVSIKTLPNISTNQTYKNKSQVSLTKWHDTNRCSTQIWQ